MATFGYTAIGGLSSDFGGNFIGVAKITTPDTAGVINKLTIRLQLDAGAPTGRALIYSDLPGAPATLLAKGTSDVTIPGVATWTDFPISYKFFPNTTLWLGLMASDDTLLFYDTVSGIVNNWDWDNHFTYPTPLNPWDIYNNFNSNVAVSLYATYDVANLISEEQLETAQHSESASVLGFGARVRTIRHTQAISPVII